MAAQRTYRLANATLTVEFGDITTSGAEVLVSSDDAYVSMGGGVSAAILRAGGQSILIDAAKKVPAKVGEVVVTSAGSLGAKYIFHAITLGEGDVDAKWIIANATEKCLTLLDALGLSSIAFPAIGAGLARFSYEDVATTMAAVMVDHQRRVGRQVAMSIYLFDRFGDREAIDYAVFFEEFALRTKELRLTEVAPDVKPAPSPHGRSQKALREAIVRSFSSEELQLLRADLEEQLRDKGIDVRLSREALGGDGVPAQVQNLIDALERIKQTAALVEAVRQQRPDAFTPSG